MDEYINNVTCNDSPLSTICEVFVQGIPSKLRPYCNYRKKYKFFRFNEHKETNKMIFDALGNCDIKEDKPLLIYFKGGEPLCPENINFIYEAMIEIKKTYPKAKFYIITGYTYEAIRACANEIYGNTWPKVVYKKILETADYLISYPYQIVITDEIKPIFVNLHQDKEEKL